MEKNIGYLEGVSGHTYDTIYNLLFTTERVMALLIHHPAEVPYKFGLQQLLLGGQLGRRQKERFDRRQSVEEQILTYESKTFDELLAGHRFNFEIPYQMVATVEITRSFFQTRLNFQLNSSSIPGGTIHFTFSKDQVPAAQTLLNLAIPSKIKKK
jgi:hypothetical protein